MYQATIKSSSIIFKGLIIFSPFIQNPTEHVDFIQNPTEHVEVVGFFIKGGENNKKTWTFSIFVAWYQKKKNYWILIGTHRLNHKLKNQEQITIKK